MQRSYNPNDWNIHGLHIHSGLCSDSPCQLGLLSMLKNKLPYTGPKHTNISHSPLSPTQVLGSLMA